MMMSAILALACVGSALSIVQLVLMRSERYLVGVAIGIIGLCTMLRNVVQDRGSIIDGAVYGYNGSSTSIGDYISMFMTAFLLFVVALFVVKRCVSRQKLGVQKGGYEMGLGVLLMTLGPVSSALLGANPSFHYSLFILPCFVGVVYMARGIDHEWVVKVWKSYLASYLFLSLVAWVVAPAEWSFYGVYGAPSGWFGSDRLRGIALNPNGLGYMAVVFIAIEMHWPTWRRWHHVAGLLMALVILIAAQSKTAWAIGIALIIARAIRSGSRQGSSVAGRAFLLSALAVGSGLVLFLIASELSGLWTSDRMQSLMTLTGRVHIWANTIATWQESPIWGYGPELWSMDYRMAQGYGLWAGHAHNQFIQTLGESGLVGIAGLSTYLTVLLIYCYRLSTATSGLSIALFLCLFLRMFTETPLKLRTIDETFLFHGLLFLFLVSAHRDARASKPALAPAEDLAANASVPHVPRLAV